MYSSSVRAPSHCTAWQQCFALHRVIVTAVNYMAAVRQFLHAVYEKSSMLRGIQSSFFPRTKKRLRVWPCGHWLFHVRIDLLPAKRSLWFGYVITSCGILVESRRNFQTQIVGGLTVMNQRFVTVDRCLSSYIVTRHCSLLSVFRHWCTDTSQKVIACSTCI